MEKSDEELRKEAKESIPETQAIICACIDLLKRIKYLDDNYRQYEVIKELVPISCLIATALIAIYTDLGLARSLVLMSQFGIAEVENKIKDIENVIEQSKGKSND